LEKDKPPILGLIQRGGEVVLHTLANVQQRTIKPVITAAVAPGTLVHTDERGGRENSDRSLSGFSA